LLFLSVKEALSPSYFVSISVFCFSQKILFITCSIASEEISLMLFVQKAVDLLKISLGLGLGL